MLLPEPEGKTLTMAFQFLIQDYKPIEIFTRKVFDQKLEYIHNNPVKDGFVEQPEHWLYSIARNCAGFKVVIGIMYL